VSSRPFAAKPSRSTRTDELKQRRGDIPWKDIAGTRDHLIHGYDLIDHRVLWDAVHIDIPRLIKAIDELLA
jgi:uncharacterized protein with HEPN domain